MTAPEPNWCGARQEDAIGALRPWLTWPAWAPMGLCALAGLLVPGALTRLDPWQFVPLFVGFVFLALPHGAWDHRVVPAAAPGGGSAGPGFLIRFVSAYAGLVLLFGLLWPASPVLAMWAFLLMSWMHWGQGDAFHRHAFTGVPRGSDPVPSWLVWAVRGGAPIVLPLLRFPEVSGRVAAGVAGRFAGDAITAQTFVLAGAARGGALAALLAFAAANVALSLLAARRASPPARRALRADAGEVALLYATFALAPPVLAVGVYFAVWHGARHIARLLVLDPMSRDLCARGRVPAALWRFYAQSFPVLLAALALLGGWYAVQASTVRGAADLASLYLALVAALTFPHFLLVLWLDRLAPAGGEGTDRRPSLRPLNLPP